MKLRSLILGSVAAAGLSVFGPFADDLAAMGSLMRGTGPGLPRHRHGGARAHRNWKRTRASGRR